jgi:hypothetical protein
MINEGADILYPCSSWASATQHAAHALWPDSAHSIIQQSFAHKTTIMTKTEDVTRWAA